jgi:alanine racemase
MYMGRPTRAEINLSAIRANLLNVRALLAPGTRLCAVVKADGYGHGAAQVAYEAVKAGADYLAVAVLSEALDLRGAGLALPILILGYTPPYQYGIVAEAGLSQAVFSLEQARALSEAGEAVGRRVKAHLKLDTGMSRLGARVDEAPELAEKIAALPGLELEGVFTHFAKADNPDKSHARGQFAEFCHALDGIKARGLRIPLRHCANSAAILDLPEAHLDMVRPGIILYGLKPSPETGEPFKAVPAMCFKTSIAMLKSLPAGRCVSYGCIYTTSGREVIATLPVGYADGLARGLSARTEVLVKGVRAPLIGRICMDQCMADVSAVPGVREGDEVTIFGAPELGADEVAERLGTINYELVCMVSPRVPRVYLP